MSLMKKTRNDAVKAAVASYLERRNYPDVERDGSSMSQTAEQMAVDTMIQCEASRANSILFSCINNDPGQYDVQFSRLVNFIKEIRMENTRNELLGLLCPLLCHLYLEMLRGGHGGAAQMFLKRHSATLPQKDLSYHQPIDGNLPSALYRPNSLEQLFNSLQNGTIDNETPERDFMNQILDDIGSIYTLQEVESRPSIAAFRSCKYDVILSQDAFNLLKGYLAKHGHVLLIQVLQTWFHIEVNNEPTMDSENEDEDEEERVAEEINVTTPTSSENPRPNDAFLNCNGHASEYPCLDKDLQELHDAIKSVREAVTPVKLYKVAAPDAYLVCAKTDPECNILCAGMSNSEIRLWYLGRNDPKKRHNRNISEIELACNMPIDPDMPADNTLQIGTGIPLRGHSGPISGIGIRWKEQVVISVSHDGTMRAWRLSDYSCAAIYRAHNNYPIWCLDVSKSGIFALTGSHDRTAKLWSFDRTFPIRVFVGHNSDVTSVAFHPNEAYVATGSGGSERVVRLWCSTYGRLLRVLGGHRGALRAIAFSPGGAYLASTGDDKKIKVWDLAACSCVHEYRGHHGKVTALDWSAGWKSSQKQQTKQQTKEETKLALPQDSDGSLLCSAGMDGIVKLFWDNRISTGQEVQSATYTSKCSYLVDVQVHPDWVVAIGTNR